MTEDDLRMIKMLNIKDCIISRARYTESNLGWPQLQTFPTSNPSEATQNMEF